jgi:outer membrane protein assembly factor BamB
VTSTGLVWSYPLQKHVMATPAVYRGLVFIADCGHMLHCVEADTGKPVWTHELKGEVWASPFIADEKLFLGTRSGDFYVLAAGREKRVITSLNLDSAISGTVTVANGVVYVTTMKRLYAIQVGQGNAQ